MSKVFLFIPSFLADDWEGIRVKGAIIAVMWFSVIAAVALDLWSGLQKARVLGEKPQSDKFRRTVTKIGDYWRILAFGLILDIIGSTLPFYGLSYVSIFASMACIVIELKSVIENSAARKSRAAKVPEIINEIISCKDRDSAKKIITKLFNIEDKHGNEN